MLVAKREDVPHAILEEFNIDLCSNTLFVAPYHCFLSIFSEHMFKKHAQGSNSLHIAAKNGFTEFVKLAITRGFTKLLTYSNQDGLFPVQIAIQHNQYDTAAVMLREMND